ncbi:type III secretion system stator protein SctL [Bradyrhizobium sp. USDA 4353]
MATAAQAAIAEGRRRLDSPIVRADQLPVWHASRTQIEDAQQRSAELLASAQQAYEAERRRGFDDGRRAGVEEAVRLIASTKASCDAFVAQLETDLRQIVVDILRDMLAPLDPAELNARAVNKAVEAMQGRGELVVRAAPDNVAPLREHLARIMPEPALRVDADSSVPDGACLLVSAFGQIDLTIDTQLQLLTESLLSSCAQAT